LWEQLRAYAETGSVNLVQANSTVLRPTWQVQAGSSDVSAKGSMVWKAPAQPGPYDVTLIVSDGIIRVGQRVVLDVRAPGATGTPRPSGTGTPTPRPSGTVTATPVR
jgi:hypothetical protein